MICQTKTNQVAAWFLWNNFLIRIGIQESVFLDGLIAFQKNVTIHTFDQSFIEAAISNIYNKNLVGLKFNTTALYWNSHLGKTTVSTP